MTSETTRMRIAITSNRNVEMKGLPGLVAVEAFTLRVMVSECASGPLVLVVLPVTEIV